MPHILDTLKERGFIAQITFEDELYKLLANERVTFYTGFDPTADSLTAGHVIPIMAHMHLQRAGHRPIVLVGGGTGMIGDPSDRTEMRKFLDEEQLAKNLAGIRAQLGRFLNFENDAALMVNNADWLLDLNYVDFLREIGVHFSVNRMLSADCYKSRYEKGLTFLEFNYMLMQAYDFLELNRRYGCTVQYGGDDQWSNILAGADLIRRKEQRDAFAMTAPLLTTSDGVKMGKSAAGALWIDAERTSPYDYFQYWRNIDDTGVRAAMLRLTFLSIDEINGLLAPGANINEAKRIMAHAITAIVHGEDAADAAVQMAASLFGGDASNAPTTQLPREEVLADARIVKLMVSCGLAKSIGEARRLVEGGGVAANNATVAAADAVASEADFAGEGLLLRKGKKVYHRIQLI